MELTVVLPQRGMVGVLTFLFWRKDTDEGMAIEVPAT